MTTFIAVYHDGVVITNEIGSYQFVRMKKETFLLNEFLTRAPLARYGPGVLEKEPSAISS
jgi:hypothetical protein